MRTVEFRFRVRTDFTARQVQEIIAALEDEETRTEIAESFDFVRYVDAETGDDGVFEYVSESGEAWEAAGG